MYFACSNALPQVMHLDAEKEMMSQCVALLGKFIAVREPNIRYLGLVSCRNTIVLTTHNCYFVTIGYNCYFVTA